MHIPPPSSRIGLPPASSMPFPFPPCLYRRRVDPLAVILDGSLERRGVGADDLADLLAVLEEEESGHGADGELLGDVRDLVDVELVESRVGVGVGEPLSYLSARAFFATDYMFV
jgi:hypothetical protein